VAVRTEHKADGGIDRKP